MPANYSSLKNEALIIQASNEYNFLKEGKMKKHQSGITPNNKSITNSLAKAGLPALLLALGVVPMDASEAGIIVAGGTDVTVEEIAATQRCIPCSSCVVAPVDVAEFIS